MNSDSGRNADLHLADVLSQQVEKERPDDLLAEVAEDFGDRRALANEFDSVFARAVAQDRKRQIFDFLGGLSNWKPVALTAAVILVAALGALFWQSHPPNDGPWEEAQSEMNTRVSPNKLAAAGDIDLDAVQARFQQIRSAGDLVLAKNVAERYLLLVKARFGDDHPSYAKGLYELATVDEELGDYREAEPLYLRAIAITEKALGPDHPSLAAALNGLASVYEAQDQYSEAQSIYQRSLAIAERAFGPSHPDVADTRAKLTKVEARILATKKPAGSTTHNNSVHVQADSLTYGPDDRITLKGSVELYYGLFILTADTVVYDPKNQTLVADGNVVTRNPDGTRAQADRFVLPAEVRDAFVRSLSTTARDGQQIRKIPNEKQ